jgi:hypothetical protein
MEPDTTFTRRVCAVLLADVTGFSFSGASPTSRPKASPVGVLDSGSVSE